MKQTVEEAAEQLYPFPPEYMQVDSKILSIIHTQRAAFHNGARHQAEQDKNLAIEFAEWIKANAFYSENSAIIENGLWWKDFQGEDVCENTQQLFDKFMEQKTLDK